MPHENLRDLSPERLADVRRAIHHLMHRQFFCVSVGSGAVRRVLDNPRLREVVRAHFDMAGYDFQFNDEEGWYGILPRPDEAVVRKMSPSNTLVLLALALHWQRCMDSGEVDARANAVTGVTAVWERLEEKLAAGKAPAMDADRFLDILKAEFEPKDIVSVGAFDPDAGDAPMLIRPFVRLLAGDDALTRLSNYLDGEELALKREDEAALAAQAPDTDVPDMDEEEAG